MDLGRTAGVGTMDTDLWGVASSELTTHCNCWTADGRDVASSRPRRQTPKSHYSLQTHDPKMFALLKKLWAARITQTGPTRTGTRGMEQRRVGIIGLGLMGTALTERLLEAGYEVVVFNRTREKATPLLAQGGTLVR